MKPRLSEPVLLGAAFLAALAVIVGRAHLLLREESIPVLIQEEIPAADVSPERDRRLLAVIETEHDILAIDGVSLLHATRAEKTWRPAKTPDGMNLSGRFAPPRAGARRIYFYPLRPENAFVLEDLATGATRFVTGKEARELSGKRRYGLFTADPAGRSWELLNRDYDFADVLETAKGWLYALASDHAAAELRPRLLRSKDVGRTWEDVTNNAMSLGVGKVHGLLPDPDHPDRVCVEFQGMRGYVVQADEHFTWRAEFEWRWRQRHSFGEDFFGTNFFYGGIEDISDYALPATRGNYFLYPFGNRTSIEPFELTLDRTEYEFARDGAMLATATIRFRRSDHAAAIMDLRGSLDFWGIKIEDSAGQRTTILPLAQQKVNHGVTEEDFGRTQKAYEARAGVLKAELIAGKAYVRKLDLRRLAEFAKPGKYTVQLTYACPFWAGEGRVHWTGSFGGPVATIHIK